MSARQGRFFFVAIAIVILANTVAPHPARAQVILNEANRFRTPQHWAFELRFGPYSPDVDSEFQGSDPGPHETYFGKKRRVMSQAELDYQFFHAFGSAAIALQLGYFRESAQAFVTASQPPERSADGTKLSLIPAAVMLVYRFDYAANRWGVPIVPYGKIGLNYTIWTVSDANGDVAKSEMGGRGRGGTPGWQGAAGLSLRLDFLDPGAAHSLDTEAGVNHTYLFVEGAHFDASGLGRKRVLHVGDTTWMAGLLFEF